jgi:hypothetical protein
MRKDAARLKPGDSIFSTRRFASEGIKKKIVQSVDHLGNVFTKPGHNLEFAELHGDHDWHMTLRDAELEALYLVQRKLTSLEKQRRKLEVLKADLLRSTGDGK